MKNLKNYIRFTFIVFIFISNGTGLNAKMYDKIETKKLILNVFYKEAKDKDTLILGIDNILYTTLEQYKNRIESVKNKHGYFRFEIFLSDAHGYFVLMKKRTFTDNGSKQLMSMIEPFFYESGDSITIYLSHKETVTGIVSSSTIYGQGASKYNLTNRLRTFRYNPNLIPKITAYPFGFDGNILRFKAFDAISDFNKARLKLIETNKTQLTPLAYDILKADVLYSGKIGIVLSIAQYGRDSLPKKNLDIQKAFKIRFEKLYDGKNNYGISSEALANSVEYIRFLFTKMRAASSVYIGAKSMNWTYNAIKELKVGNSYNSKIKDNLVMLLFMIAERDSETAIELYSDAKQIVQDSSYRHIISQLELRSPGRDFSNYSLKDIKDTSIKFSQFKGKVILLDFWFTGCGHCEVYYKNILSKVKHIFKDKPEIVFISISGDVEKTVWQNSIKSERYTSIDAINLYTEGLGMKHNIVADNLIRGFPCAILLDRAGKIKFFNTENLYNLESLVQIIEKML